MLSFDAAKHEYRWDGQVVPSVTQIVDRLNDLSFIKPEHLEAARERGTDVHLACLLDDLGDLAEETVTEEVAGYLAGWRKFRSECKPVWIEMEHMEYHPLYRYAGTWDRVGMVFGTLTLADLKTGPFSPAIGVQLAGYELVWNQLHPDNQIKRRMSIHLTRDGNYRIAKHDSLLHTRAFLSLLTVDNWSKEFGR